MNSMMLFPWCLLDSLGPSLTGPVIEEALRVLQSAPPATSAWVLDGSAVTTFDVASLQSALPYLALASQRGIARIVLVTTHALASFIREQIETASGVKSYTFTTLSDAEKWLKAGCPE